MRLEIGKRYTTKSGAITAPLEPFGCGATSGWPFIDRVAGMTYRSDGRYWKSCADDELDLVAEYFEPAPAADEYESLASHDAHNIAAEELLHSRIRQLESLLAEADARDARNVGLVHDLESRIAGLEQQLADSEKENARLLTLLQSSPAIPARLDTLCSELLREWQKDYERWLANVVVTPEPAFVLQDDSISSWLHKLPDGYRELALANYAASGTKRAHADSVSTALWFAFSWIDSDEGGVFWKQVAGHYETCGVLPLPEIP